MDTVKTIKEVRQKVREWRADGLTIGLVPTMGFLHEGHRSLIERAAAENDRVIVSDFVNPTQFGAGEDLESYPRDIERDQNVCLAAGADLIFHPKPEEMYFPDACTAVDMTGDITSELCGKSRPIHFKGVCTVVSKLFNITTPDRAYFGQKDAQQLAVIRRMTRDLREEDGLAKSSRNTYLNSQERKAALVLSRAVALGFSMAENGERDAEKILRAMTDLIEQEPLAKIDYVKAVDASNITPVNEMTGEVLIAMAVYIGSTRLIDNFIYKS